jgi:6-phosphogluconolactonase
LSRDHEENSRRAAALIQRAAEAAGGRGAFALVLPGGSTPARLFELLSEGYPTPLAWERTHLFWSDERCVPPNHPQSNYGNARAGLIQRVPLPAANVHRMRGEDPPPRAAASYRRRLAAFFGSPRPAFDLALLGLGRDGHTCSLFPGSAALASAQAVAAARAPEGVADRITLTPVALRGARRVLFLVSGEEKARAVARTLDGKEDPAACPARAIRPASGEALWLLDRAAAAELWSVRKRAARSPRSAGPGRSR